MIDAYTAGTKTLDAINKMERIKNADIKFALDYIESKIKESCTNGKYAVTIDDIPGLPYTNYLKIVGILVTTLKEYSYHVSATLDKNVINVNSYPIIEIKWGNL